MLVVHAEKTKNKLVAGILQGADRVGGYEHDLHATLGVPVVLFPWAAADGSRRNGGSLEHPFDQGVTS